jgi:hypothetical protein
MVSDMSFEQPGAGAPDYQPCRYGQSKLRFRGPKPRLDLPYIAFLGGAETFGRFLERPFVQQIGPRTGLSCLNLGCPNAGLDAFAQDRTVIDLARRARVRVLQVPSGQNLTNRFYRVHPRRNDRFLAATPLLQAMYSNIDFTEIHFNRHLLARLHDASPVNFATVRAELQNVWLARMRGLLSRLGDDTLLLWLRYAPDPDEKVDRRLGGEPLLVTPEMIAELARHASGVVEVPIIPAGPGGEMGEMHFGALEEPVAAHMLGPSMHALIARRLAHAILPLLK